MGKEKEKLWRKVENYCIDVQALPVANGAGNYEDWQTRAKTLLLKNSNSAKSQNKNDKIIHCKISTLGDVWNLERVGLKYGTRPVYNDKQERTGRRLPHRFPLLVRTSSLPMVRRKDGTDPCATKNQANDFCSKSRFLLYVARKVLKDKAWSSSWDRTRLYCVRAFSSLSRDDITFRISEIFAHCESGPPSWNFNFYYMVVIARFLSHNTLIANSGGCWLRSFLCCKIKRF